MGLDLSLLDEIPAAPGAAYIPPKAPPAAFEEDPDQPRFEFDDDDEFAALVADIERRGVLQPLVVRRMPSGMLRIRFGALRYRASVRAGLAAIPYVETEDERQFDDYAQVAENERRKPLQPLERSRFIMRKLAAGELRKDIAAKLHIDASAITHLLVLVEDPPPLLLELYYSRRCRAPYYLYLLLKLLRRDHVLVEQRLADAAVVVDIGLIVEMTRQVEQRATPPRDAAAPLPADGTSALEPVAGMAMAAGSPTRERADLTKPQLLGGHMGRSVEVLLRRCPDTDGVVWVRYEDDGDVVQVRIADVVLSCLRQRCGGSGPLRMR